MPNINDYHAYKSTQGSSGGTGRSGNGKGPNGAGWLIIILAAIMLLYFILSGASWDAIDSLLGISFIVYLIVNWLFS